MLNKTKAALQSRSSQLTTSNSRFQDSTVILLVNTEAGFPASVTVIPVSMSHYPSSIGGLETHNLGIVLLICNSGNLLISKQGAKLRRGYAALQYTPNSQTAPLAQFNLSRLNFEPADIVQSFAFSLASRCIALLRLPTSLYMDLRINFDGVSPSIITSSIKSNTSWGSLTVTDLDFELTGPVGICAFSLSWCKTVYTKKCTMEVLRCKTLDASFVLHLHLVKVKKVKPGCALTHSRLLTTDVIASNEAAMKDHITPPQGRNSYIYRFLALSATERHVIHITATTEREAREQSPQGCVMVFAGRLPAEVRHA